MDPRDPDRDRQQIRRAINFALWTALCFLLILNACSGNSGSRIHVELRDTPEANPPAQALKPAAICPPGDPPGGDPSPTPAAGHTVTLSWNASTSSSAPNGKEIRYCLYRTKGARVQGNTPGAGTKSPCVNCQRVTKQPISGTSYPDTHVENGAHYCYVAIAVDGQTGKLSVFSNQADAVIPPNTEHPFCTPTDNPKQAPRAKSPRRR
jgi:hypothetical protein